MLITGDLARHRRRTRDQTDTPTANSAETNRTRLRSQSCRSVWGMQELILHVLQACVGPASVYRRPQREPDVPRSRRTRGGDRDRVRPRSAVVSSAVGVLLQIHDPSTLNRQGNDRGTSYRSAIFFTSPAQQAEALDTIADVDASGCGPGPVVTEVTPDPRSGRPSRNTRTTCSDSPGEHVSLRPTGSEAAPPQSVHRLTRFPTEDVLGCAPTERPDPGGAPLRQGHPGVDVPSSPSRVWVTGPSNEPVARPVGAPEASAFGGRPRQSSRQLP